MFPPRESATPTGITDVSSLCIFCADTETGYRLTELARWAGLEVIAVVRARADTSVLANFGPRIIVANPLDRVEVAGVFADLDPQGLAVVCTLGGNAKLNSQGNINVIDAAEEAGVRRFLIVTSIGCGDSADTVDEFVKTFIGKALRAKNWAESHIRSKNMDWTIIRPGRLMRNVADDNPLLVENPHVTGCISPFDLGDAIFRALQSPATIHKTLTAVNNDDAVDITGKSVVAADL